MEGPAVVLCKQELCLCFVCCPGKCEASTRGEREVGGQERAADFARSYALRSANSIRRELRVDAVLGSLQRLSCLHTLLSGESRCKQLSPRRTSLAAMLMLQDRRCMQSLHDEMQ